jgi:hypothetical protein
VEETGWLASEFPTGTVAGVFSFADGVGWVSDDGLGGAVVAGVSAVRELAGG